MAEEEKASEIDAGAASEIDAHFALLYPAKKAMAGHAGAHNTWVSFGHLSQVLVALASTQGILKSLFPIDPDMVLARDPDSYMPNPSDTDNMLYVVRLLKLKTATLRARLKTRTHVLQSRAGTGRYSERYNHLLTLLVELHLNSTIDSMITTGGRDTRVLKRNLIDYLTKERLEDLTLDDRDLQALVEQSTKGDTIEAILNGDFYADEGALGRALVRLSKAELQVLANAAGWAGWTMPVENVRKECEQTFNAIVKKYNKPSTWTAKTSYKAWQTVRFGLAGVPRPKELKPEKMETALNALGDVEVDIVAASAAVDASAAAGAVVADETDPTRNVTEQTFKTIFTELKTVDNLTKLADYQKESGTTKAANWLKLFYSGTEIDDQKLAIACTHLLHTPDMQAKNTKGQLGLSYEAADMANDLFVECIVCACYHAIVELSQTLGLVSSETRLYPKKEMDRKFEHGGTGDKDLIIERGSNIERGSPPPPLVSVLTLIGVRTDKKYDKSVRKRWDDLAKKYKGNKSMTAMIQAQRFRSGDTAIEIKTGDESSEGSGKAIAQATHMTYAVEAYFSRLVTILCSSRADKPGWRSRLYDEDKWIAFATWCKEQGAFRADILDAFFPESLSPYASKVSRHRQLLASSLKF